MSIFVWLVLSKRKAIRNRLHLNIRPNVIEIEGGEKFRGEFSSETRLLISTDAFRTALESVVLRDSYTRGRFVFAREAAYVRIWPGAIGISDLEADAIHMALAEEFVELEVEVLRDGEGQRPHATAVKA